MKITDKKTGRSAAFVNQKLIIPLPTAVSQTGVVAFKYTPGFAFRVTRVRSYNRVKAGAVAGKVKIGTRESVAALAFTSATEVAQTLSATDSNNKGSATDALSVEYTSDGSGVLTNGVVIVEIRALVAR